MKKSKPTPPRRISELAEQTETDITRSIRQLLNACGIWHWKQWQMPMSQPAGVADILGIFNGKFLAIEVKRLGAELTRCQRYFLERVNREGGIAFVAHSIEDVIDRLGLENRFLITRRHGHA